MMECCAKKLLRVNLSTGTTQEEALPEAFLERWIGGMGLGVRLMTREVPAGVDALAPENKLYFCVGPLTGTNAPLFAQTCVVTKSPLTGGILNSYAGGFLGGAIKALGCDAIVIEGRADELVYLLLTPKGARLVPCPDLKGADAHRAEAAVRSAAGGAKAPRDLVTLAVGLAGENRVRYSAIISETRAFGRGGAGAVMGSKNLKAIGVAGIGDARVARPEAFQTAVEAVYRATRGERSHPGSLVGGVGRVGTGSGIGLVNEKYLLATRHHRQTHFDRAEEIGGEAYAQKYKTRPVACLGCPIHCGMLRSPANTRWGTVWTRGPEYETMYSLGSLCFNDDPDMLLKANDQAEAYGMDTLSLGVNVAFAMECAERGILPRSALGSGTRLEFGSPDATLRLIDMIAHREGLGDVLAEGVGRAAQILGGGSEAFALQVKGMEFAAWMPERMRGIATTFATSNRGACHKRAPIGAEIMGFLPAEQVEGKAAIVAEIQNRVNALFTLVSCRFAEFFLPTPLFLGLLNAATGMDYEEAAFVRLGETIWNLERLYNLEAGLDARQDRLPDICFQAPEDLPPDARPLTREDFAALMRDYYEVRGWDAQGRPSPERLAQLGIL